MSAPPDPATLITTLRIACERLAQVIHSPNRHDVQAGFDAVDDAYRCLLHYKVNRERGLLRNDEELA